MEQHKGWSALLAMVLATVGSARAQVAPVSGLPSAEEQWEADYRVIAARCGTPAFEKAFSNQSRQAVSAGLVSKRAEPAAIERSIGNLRRSSLTLVAASSDCPAKLAQLAELQRARKTLLGSAGKPAADKAR